MNERKPSYFEAVNCPSCEDFALGTVVKFIDVMFAQLTKSHNRDQPANTQDCIEFFIYNLEIRFTTT